MIGYTRVITCSDAAFRGNGRFRFPPTHPKQSAQNSRCTANHAVLRVENKEKGITLCHKRRERNHSSRRNSARNLGTLLFGMDTSNHFRGRGRGGKGALAPTSRPAPRRTSQAATPQQLELRAWARAAVFAVGIHCQPHPHNTKKLSCVQTGQAVQNPASLKSIKQNKNMEGSRLRTFLSFVVVFVLTVTGAPTSRCASAGAGAAAATSRCCSVTRGRATARSSVWAPRSCCCRCVLPCAGRGAGGAGTGVISIHLDWRARCGLRHSTARDLQSQLTALACTNTRQPGFVNRSRRLWCARSPGTMSKPGTRAHGRRVCMRMRMRMRMP